MALGTTNLELRRHKAFDLIKQNRLVDAKVELESLSVLLPADSVLWLELGRVQVSLGLVGSAIASLHKAVGLDSDSVDAHFLLGVALGRSGNLADAQKSLAHTLRMQSDHMEACIALGVVMQLSGNLSKALGCFEQALELEPNNVELNIRLGSVYTGIDTNKAEIFYRHALKHHPDNPQAICGLACLHTYRGYAAGAYRVLMPLLKSKPVNLKAAVAFAGICRSLQRCDEAIDLLESGLSGGVDLESNILAHFALGKLYDNRGEYTQAFGHFSEGNMLANRQYNPWEEVSWFKGIMVSMDAGFFSRTPRAKRFPKLKRPVFIVGMPRSGTTLVEQILASHPTIYGAGELVELGDIAVTLPDELGDPLGYPSCLDRLDKNTLNKVAQRYLKHISDIAPAGAAVVIDKMPDNFRYLGLVELLFPESRIIHCKRDPMDTCLSCYFQHFEGGHFYSYDLRSLGAFYGMYERLMHHWCNTLSLPVLDVQYERLVEHPEQVSRDMVDFCGLEWSPKCLQYFAEQRDVVTASHDQVRQPIYNSSVGRWEHYSEHLQSLRKALAQKII